MKLDFDARITCQSYLNNYREWSYSKFNQKVTQIKITKTLVL